MKKSLFYQVFAKGVKMKKHFLLCIGAIIMCLFILTACKAGLRADEDTPFAACDSQSVVIELYENQALPYRWELASITGHGCLIAQEEELITGDAFPLSAGNAPAARSFSFSWAEDGVSDIVFKCMRIEEYRESPDDYCKAYTFHTEKQGNSASIECVEPQ